MSISSDARIVIITRALRTFGYGFTSVLLGLMLIDAGTSPLQIGILLAVAALGSIVCSLVMGMYADRVGRKRLLILSALLMMVTGYIFALTQWYPLLVLASFFGTISPSTNDNSPFSGIEQAILAQSVETEQYTPLFSSSASPLRLNYKRCLQRRSGQTLLHRIERKRACLVLLCSYRRRRAC